MQFKDYALIGGGALFGAVFVLTVGVTRAEDKAVIEVPGAWQVAANTEAGSPQPAISLDEMSRRMEEKYNGKVTEIELDREWNREVYEVEIRTADGYEWDIEADAATGEILEEKRERDD